MTRPGLVLEVDERTPPLIVHSGEKFSLEKFPLGSRVIYPPDSLPGIKDVRGAIRKALLDPLGQDPLPEQLFAGMKLTIAFDDISLPLPQMKTPDIRGVIIEEVIEMAARKRVEDIELIVANALHRRMTPAEIERAVGERVFRSFWPDALRNFDAEDPQGLKVIGTTKHKELVEIDKRAAESDLIVYVNINLVAMDGGHKSVSIGLAGYKSLRYHHNVDTMMKSHSYMDPREGRSALHDSAWRMGRLLAESGVKIFQIESTLNNDTFPKQLGFLNKREWEWSVKDQATYLAARKGVELMPAKVRHDFMMKVTADYGITGVAAGEVEAVHEQTLANLHRQQLTEIEGQSDVVVFGLPYLSPYNANSIMNPILVHCLGLGYYFNMYRNQPVVRPGGTVILFHPTPWEFNQVHHPSYIDFFDEVLTQTKDPAEMEKQFEERYATDPWYIHLYRNSYAYHGVHPFYMWYWGAHGRDYAGDVIFVGADRKAVQRMGYRTASSMADALEMAKDSVGSSPSITYLHSPPLTLADVR